MTTGAYPAANRRRTDYGMLYVAPTVLLLILLLYGPAVSGFWQSLFRLDGADAGAFVGLDVYGKVLAEPGFGKVVLSTTLFVVGSVIGTVGLGLAIALYVNSLEEATARILQIGVIIPWAISSVVGALLFRWFYMSDLGLFQGMLRGFGLPAFDPMSTQAGAMTALILSAVWKKLGFAVILLLSGLKAIPHDYYEAARIDGAGAFARFREITVPMLTGPLLISSVVLGIADLNTVELPLIVTGGGPLDSTTTVALSIYQKAFSQYDLQRAITLAIITFLVNIVLVGLYVRSVRGQSE
ncbi:ABC-type sugar transport system permease subunit [Pseudochelatococcus lubricantis]|uniref:ABC-type sugar transport system permease subunit n=1 Tax=Pseudochelatococcus lubricantis TaxID=1538102 RepID=A0ABX0V1J9_9HYPH|nr:sugar ABC transporter permease [Pseudochelatococcus lubricantis]NIJ58827.1 ABC-type sugar transport system permease subunit [Pseudochelatococcus lubricantis]